MFYCFFYRVFLGYDGLYCVLPSFYWVFTGSHCFFLGFNEYILGFTGFYWVILDFAVFYHVLLGFYQV